ncbi:MAG TPA: hypothetical protein VK590_15145 [Saprospiraceae bacterium]|nr:hypothetical protein [Saprospiraceae bacterium]
MSIKITGTQKVQLLQPIFKLVGFVVILFISNNNFLAAQPINDNCSGAVNISIANDYKTIVWTEGETSYFNDAASVPGPVVYSNNFYRDDVWYKLIVPTNLSQKRLWSN